MMRCEAFEELLHPWLDGFLDETEGEAMRTHAAQCPACTERAEALREALAACAEAGAEVEVPEAAASAWRQAVRAEAARAKVVPLQSKRAALGRVQRIGGWAVSVAAGLLFLLGGATLVHEGTLGWPMKSEQNAVQSEMAAPMQSASEPAQAEPLEAAPQAAPKAASRVAEAKASDEASKDDYAEAPASLPEDGSATAAEVEAEAEAQPELAEEMLDAPAPKLSLARMATSEPLPPAEPELERGGSGFAHFLLDMATFAMMCLPLAVAGGIVYAVVRGILRRRGRKNAKK